MDRSTAGLVLAAGLLLPAVAQSQAPPPPPNLLEIVRESVRMGREGPHATLESRWAMTFRQANVPVYYIGMTSVWGPSEAWFIAGHDSYQGWEDLDRAIGSAPGLDDQVGLLATADAENISSTSSLMARYRPELSRAGGTDVARGRYLEFTIYRVRPGQVPAFEEGVRLYQKVVTEAGIPETWAVYQVTHGMAGPAFMIVVARTSLGELDPGLGERALAGALTAERAATLQRLAAAAIVSIDRKLFRLRPQLSNPSAEFSARDPGFWQSP